MAQLSYAGRIGHVASGAILARLFAVTTVIVVGTGRDKVDPLAQSRSVTTVLLGRRTAGNNQTLAAETAPEVGSLAWYWTFPAITDDDTATPLAPFA